MLNHVIDFEVGWNLNYKMLEGEKGGAEVWFLHNLTSQVAEMEGGLPLYSVISGSFEDGRKFEVARYLNATTHDGCPANSEPIWNKVVPIEGQSFDERKKYGVGRVVDEWESGHWEKKYHPHYHSTGKTYAVEIIASFEDSWERGKFMELGCPPEIEFVRDGDNVLWARVGGKWHFDVSRGAITSFDGTTATVWMSSEEVQVYHAPGTN